MTTHELRIAGMGCDHCIGTVKKALEALEGVSKVEVELGKARVEADPARAGRAQLEHAIADAGYEVVAG